MPRPSLTFGVFAWSMIAGCRTGTIGAAIKEGTTRSDSNPISTETLSCTDIIDESDHHTATIIVESDRLTVYQTSLTGRYAPLFYQMQSIPEQVPPPDRSLFACTEGSNSIEVWPKFAQVNDQSYRLTVLGQLPPL